MSEIHMLFRHLIEYIALCFPLLLEVCVEQAHSNIATIAARNVLRMEAAVTLKRISVFH